MLFNDYSMSALSINDHHRWCFCNRFPSLVWTVVIICANESRTNKLWIRPMRWRHRRPRAVQWVRQCIMCYSPTVLSSSLQVFARIGLQSFCINALVPSSLYHKTLEDHKRSSELYNCAAHHRLRSAQLTSPQLSKTCRPVQETKCSDCD